MNTVIFNHSLLGEAVTLAIPANSTAPNVLTLARASATNQPIHVDVGSGSHATIIVTEEQLPRIPRLDLVLHANAQLNLMMIMSAQHCQDFHNSVHARLFADAKLRVVTLTCGSRCLDCQGYTVGG